MPGLSDLTRQRCRSLRRSAAPKSLWSPGLSARALWSHYAAFNAFSITATVQSIAVTDGAVRQRVRRHVELLAQVAMLTESAPGGAAALIPAARRHASAVIEALEAHYNDAALPSYRPLPMGDAAELVAWQPTAAQGDGRPAPAARSRVQAARVT